MAYLTSPRLSRLIVSFLVRMFALHCKHDGVNLKTILGVEIANCI
jgi:hypothetical protein